MKTSLSCLPPIDDEKSLCLGVDVDGNTSEEQREETLCLCSRWLQIDQAITDMFMTEKLAITVAADKHS